MIIIPLGLVKAVFDAIPASAYGGFDVLRGLTRRCGTTAVATEWVAIGPLAIMPVRSVVATQTGDGVMRIDPLPLRAGSIARVLAAQLGFAMALACAALLVLALAEGWPSDVVAAAGVFGGGVLALLGHGLGSRVGAREARLLARYAPYVGHAARPADLGAAGLLARDRLRHAFAQPSGALATYRGGVPDLLALAARVPPTDVLAGPLLTLLALEAEYAEPAERTALRAAHDALLARLEALDTRPAAS